MIGAEQSREPGILNRSRQTLPASPIKTILSLDHNCDFKHLFLPSKVDPHVVQSTEPEIPKWIAVPRRSMIVSRRHGFYLNLLQGL